MHDTAARREHARHATGRFGAQHRTPPEVEVPSRVAGAAATARTVRTRALRLDVPVTRTGWFGRTRVHQVPVDVRVHETTADATVNDPDRGERIYLGQAHLPVTRDGAPARADDATLIRIAAERTADIDSPDAASASREARARLRDLLVIDGQLWARASRAREFSSRAAHMTPMTISRDAAARRENARQSTGEFGEHARSAPELTLDASVSEVVGEATIRYTQTGVIPPRARKPRDVQLEATVPVRVAVVDAEDAPVALTMSSSRWRPEGEGVIEIRTIDGRMFRPVEDRDGQHVKVTPDTVGQLHRGYRDETYPAYATDQFIRDSLERNANSDLEGYRVIDGALWQATGTPVYKVEVYGHAHSADVRQDLYIGEPGPLPHGYYAPHEYDLAVTEARGRCGNDDARARFDEHLRDAAMMTLTEAYTPDSRHPTPPRVEYPEPYTLDRDYGRPGYPPRRQANLDEAWGKMRDGLLAHPGAVIEVDDGFGGTTRTIDRAVLSVKQARDFDEFQGMYAALRAPRT